MYRPIQETTYKAFHYSRAGPSPGIKNEHVLFSPVGLQNLCLHSVEGNGKNIFSYPALVSGKGIWKGWGFPWHHKGKKNIIAGGFLILLCVRLSLTAQTPIQFKTKQNKIWWQYYFPKQRACDFVFLHCLIDFTGLACNRFGKSIWNSYSKSITQNFWLHKYQRKENKVEYLEFCVNHHPKKDKIMRTSKTLKSDPPSSWSKHAWSLQILLHQYR